MRARIIICLLFVFLFAGCNERSAVEISRGSHVPVIDSVSDVPTYNDEGISVPEPEGVLMLRQVLALTLMNNPELKAFSLETKAAQARRLQAGLWPNPELEVEVEEVGGSGNRSGFDGAETTIQLSQLIELGDKSQKRKRIASFEKELADINYQDKSLEVFSQAATAFIAVLEAQEKLQLSNELLKLSEESFNAVERRVNAGKDSPLEKTRASVVLSNIRIQHRKTQRVLEYARRELASFWGQSWPQFEQVMGDLEQIDELPELEHLTNKLKQNPQYAWWKTEIKKSQAVLDLEKANAIGNITVGAGLQRFNETDENAVVFGFSIPIPIFDRNQWGKQEAVYNLAKSRQEQRAAWLKLQNEFNQTYQKYANSYSQAVSIKKEVLPGAAQMFNAATRAYQEGKVDYLNVLDAQRTLFEAKRQYIEALSAYHKARADVERLIGQKIDTIETIQQQ